MIDMDKIARIRQEIERQKEINKKLLDGQLKDGCLYALNQVLSFLDTLSEEPNTPEFPETFEICLYDGRTPDNEKCTECSTTCSMRKEEPNKKDLNDAIKKFIEEYGYRRGADKLLIAIVARHFAEWQASQMPMPEDTVLFNKGVAEGRRLEREDMMKDAVEGYVNYYEDSGGILMAEAQVGCPYHNGDKVRIVVLKEEEE